MDSRGLFFAFLAAVTVAHAAGPEPAFVCGTEPSTLRALAKTAATTAVSGPLRILVLRVAFKDKAYTTDTAAMSATNDRVAQFYQDNSYGAVSLSFRFYPTVIKAPGYAQDYADDWESFAGFLKSRMHDLGLAKGDGFDRYVVNFPSIKLDWVGLSSGPSSGANYINGNYNSGVVAHELGHAVGLPHAASMEAGKKIVGSGSDDERDEYGDAFDVMGHGGILGHFNSCFKRRLGWMTPGEAAEADRSGMFRVYAHDNPAKSGNLLALHLPAGNGKYSYWIEYRTSYASEYVKSRHAAGIRMEDYFSGGKTALLDMSPESRDPEYDFNDANLELGKEFRDPFGNFSVKPVAVNEGAWDQNGWVDVQVTWDRSVPTVGTSASPSLAAFTSDLPALAFDAGGRRIPAAALSARARAFLAQGVYYSPASAAPPAERSWPLPR